MCFVDLEKAFDHVPWGVLWEVLREYGVSGPLLWAIRSLYNCCKSLVRIAGNKPDSFPVGDGLRQGCPLSLILFIIFMDRISRHSQVAEGFHFGGLRISSLLFADDAVLLASSGDGLQLALERFACECEAAGMRISTSKSEAMVLRRKRVECPLRVGDEFLPQVEEFKYLEVLFASDGRREPEIDRRIGAAAAVIRTLHRSVVVKRELSVKAKLSMYRSIYVPTHTFGHKLWVVTERTRSQIVKRCILRHFFSFESERRNTQFYLQQGQSQSTRTEVRAPRPAPCHCPGLYLYTSVGVFVHYIGMWMRICVCARVCVGMCVCVCVGSDCDPIKTSLNLLVWKSSSSSKQKALSLKQT
uniref:Reverse transcriptase domain-containing protein n=1 Tax=Oreochromis niloticus TaxID=8128 RepID=A0A669EEJ8_ORENI